MLWPSLSLDNTLYAPLYGLRKKDTDDTYGGTVPLESREREMDEMKPRRTTAASNSRITRRNLRRQRSWIRYVSWTGPSIFFLSLSLSLSLGSVGFQPINSARTPQLLSCQLLRSELCPKTCPYPTPFPTLSQVSTSIFIFFCSTY